MMNLMTNDRRWMLRAGAIAPCMAFALMLAGCNSEPEPEPVVYTPPPPAPVDLPPPVMSVADLKAHLRIDPRVHLPEDRAPSTTEARTAVLEFFDSFARGDDRALAKLLSDLDRSELESMVASGEWKRATQGITSIEIQTGPSMYGDCALAIIETGMDYLPLLWYYSKSEESYVFEAARTPPDMISQLSGVDWIAAWHEILEEEEELALRPDTPADLPQRKLAEDDGGASGGQTPGSPPPPGDSPGGPPIAPAW